MQTISEILQTEFELIRQDLIKKHNELGMKASGKFEDNLEVLYKEIENRIIISIQGMRYTGALQFGRGPTSTSQVSNPPLIEMIEEWIKVKGIRPIESSISTRQLAFLITRKIHKEGTRYFREGGTDLVSSVITEKRMDSILQKIEKVSINIYTDSILKQYARL